MSEIRRLTEADLDALVTITNGAYPPFAANTPEQRGTELERHRANLADPELGYFGAFREGRLAGSMLLWDFTMNVYGAQVLAGGVGMVAVDLFHKKQHVAKDLISFYLEHYRQRGAPFALLHPFRPDFYKRMGFGYGVKANEYRVRPAALPAGDRAGVAPLSADDIPALVACYNRLQARTHGLIRRAERPFARRFSNPELYAVGYRESGELRGYLFFQFKSAGVADNFTANDIHVAELLYENPAALRALLAFLHTQADQVRHVIFRTQDAHFSDLFHDPRTADSAEVIPYVVMAHVTNTQGAGIMYRVLDTAGAFRALAAHNFGGQSLRLKISVRDSFLPANDGAVVVRFREGYPEVVAEDAYEAEIALDVAEFSSLLLGVVSFRSLYQHGLATLSDPAYLDTVSRLFLAEEPPVNLTAF
jgi:predicted acetyltransferase